MLFRSDAVEVAEQALMSSLELQAEVATKAASILATPGSDLISGTSSSQPLIHIESDSSPLSTSQSKTSSSSSSDMDDVPISILRKGLSPSSKLHTNSSKPISPFKPLNLLT